ncbi:hypothetical protein PybrP1_010695, partial [[Pythium] brassicae (nom. inval.)]
MSLALARAAAPSTSSSPLPALYSTVGVHPTRCSEFDENDEQLDADAYFAQLAAICEDGARDGRVVAIGECGLDYDRLEFCDKETQRKYFEKQFELAERMRLPMFLHNRNTDGDFYEMIAKNRSRFSNGVVHSFTGSSEEALKLVELGLYIDNIETVRVIPTEHLMIETEKYEAGCLVKGRNEPCTLVQVLEIVSAIRGEDPDDLAQKIHENTCKVFFP